VLDVDAAGSSPETLAREVIAYLKSAGQIPAWFPVRSPTQSETSPKGDTGPHTYGLHVVIFCRAIDIVKISHIIDILSGSPVGPTLQPRGTGSAHTEDTHVNFRSPRTSPPSAIPITVIHFSARPTSFLTVSGCQHCFRQAVTLAALSVSLLQYLHVIGRSK